MSVVFPLESFSSDVEIRLSSKVIIRRVKALEKEQIVKNFKIEHAWKDQVLEIGPIIETTNLVDTVFSLAYNVISALRLFKRGKVGILEPIFHSIEKEEEDKILTQFYLSDSVEVIKTRGYKPPLNAPFLKKPMYLYFFRGYTLKNRESNKFKKFFRRFCDAKEFMNLIIPINRMNRAQSYNDFIYGIVDNTIALESILKRKPTNRRQKNKKNKKRQKNESSSDVIRRSKAILGYSLKEQKIIHYHMKICYKLRNSLVHGSGRIQRPKVENNFRSVKKLEHYLAEVITSSIALYEKQKNKEKVLKIIDKCDHPESHENEKLHKLIQQFWEA